MQAAVAEYFRVWNAHDEQGIKALHSTASTLTDWDAAHGAAAAPLLSLAHASSVAASPSPASCALPYCPPTLRLLLLRPPAYLQPPLPSPGPTNAEVATGIAGIWKAVPKIQIEVVSLFTCGEAKSCVANIKVVVDEATTLNVCDVFTFDQDFKVLSIVAYKSDE